MWRNLLIDFKTIVIAVIFFFSTSCENRFIGFADKTTDEALYYTALKGIRDADYDTAIQACTYMSGGFSARPSTAEVCASAYAGRCGFQTLDMVTYIESYAASPPPEKLFHYLMKQYSTTSASKLADCETAEDILQGIGTAAQRSDDQNGLMLLLSIHKIAVALNEAADKFGADADDGTIPGGFGACAMTAAEAQAIGSAFWELDKSLDVLSTNSLYTALDTAVDALCTALNVLTVDLCAAADPTALTAAELKGARSLIKEGAAVGVDECGGGQSLATCNCP